MNSLRLSLVLCVLCVLCGGIASCARLTSTRTPKLVDGGDIEASNYPFVAQILFKNMMRCGGVILNERYILTLAECVTDKGPLPKNRTSNAASIEDFSIQVGSTLAHVMDFQPEVEGRYKVSSVIVHPGFSRRARQVIVRKIIKEAIPRIEAHVAKKAAEAYRRCTYTFSQAKCASKIPTIPPWQLTSPPPKPSPTTTESPLTPPPLVSREFPRNDIALIKTREAIEFGVLTSYGRAGPISLPSRGSQPREGEFLRLAGFGGAEKMHGYLQAIASTSINSGACRQAYGKRNTRLDSTQYSCASSGRNSVSACNFDKGGPVFRETPQSQVLVGLIAEQLDCSGADLPNVLLNIDPFLSWIHSNME